MDAQFCLYPSFSDVYSLKELVHVKYIMAHGLKSAFYCKFLLCWSDANNFIVVNNCFGSSEVNAVSNPSVGQESLRSIVLSALCALGITSSKIYFVWDFASSCIHSNYAVT